ncbi:MAG: haloalkane dehalogenase [Salinisphaeraceae bacterium]
MSNTSADFTKKSVEVLGRRMAYVEAGTGDPVVFLHGNPTSSYLWRNILPHATSLGRCIVPDLIGMGDSDKLPDPGPGSYRFVEHRRYLDALLDALNLGDNVILVLHDWGSGLGFDWANRHRDRVAGICYMEAIVQPLSWSDLPDSMQGIFQAMRSEAGEEMVLDKNVFVERILPASIQRELTAAEMDEYRRPFTDAGEARRPTLTWPRQIPIDGEPADVTAIVDDYGRWLAASDDLPKLFINAEPGIILTGGPREFCRSWPNQTEVTVDGLHFIQEDSPDAIGRALAGFVQQVRG